MKKSKLIQLLQSLEKSELKSLRKFLISPHFNTNETLLQFFDLLVKWHPDFPENKAEKATVFQKLFPNKKYVPKKMHHQMSQLSLLIEQFLMISELEKQSATQNLLLAKALGRRLSLFDLFEKKVETSKKDLEQNSKSSHTAENLFQLNQLHFFHPHTSKHKAQIDSLQNARNQLDIFYLLSKMKLEIELLFRSNIFAQQTDFSEFENLKTLAAKIPEKEKPPVLHFYWGLIDLKESDQPLLVFTKILKDFQKDFQKLADTDARFVFQQLCNFLIHQHNTGKENSLKKLLTLYEFGLEKPFLKNAFSEPFFINLIVTAAALNDFQKAEFWLQKFSQNLPKGSQSSGFQLAEAYLRFYQKKYSEAARILHFIEMENPLYNYRIKELELRILYEEFLQNQNFKLLKSKLKSLQAFLRRDQIFDENQKQALFNTSRFIQKMIQEKIAKKQLLEELNNCQLLAAKTWLLSKVGSLE